MKPLPYLLPWGRVLLLIRSITSTTWGHEAWPLTRRDAERWLLDHGFVEAPAGKTSHKHFQRGAVKVTLPGHGPQDLSKKHIGMLVRQLVQAGFSRAELHEEWRQ